jgi:Xaa-Pro dipeptidase
VTAADHGERIERFGEALGEAGFEAAIVSHPRDLFYLVGTAQPCNLLVVPGEQPLLAARRFGELVREQAAVSNVIDAPGLGPLAERLREHGRVSGRVGFALDVVPALLIGKAERTFAGYELGDYSPILLRQRLVKDEHEIALLRRAAQMFDAAHEAVLEHARTGVAEHEVSAEIGRALRRAGHEGHVFYRRWDAFLQPEGLLTSGSNLARISGHAITITGVGMSPALPFGASERRLQKRDLVVIDMGLNYRGYHADMARSYAVEEAPEQAARLMDKLRTVWEATLASVAPGVPATAPYEAAVRACKEQKVDQWFQGYGADRGQYVGHGVGIELDEPPLLAPGDDTVLVPGMALAVEPKLISPDFGGLDIEDTVIVRDGAPERLSSVPPDLFVTG